MKKAMNGRSTLCCGSCEGRCAGPALHIGVNHHGRDHRLSHRRDEARLQCAWRRCVRQGRGVSCTQVFLSLETSSCRRLEPKTCSLSLSLIDLLHRTRTIILQFVRERNHYFAVCTSAPQSGASRTGFGPSSTRRGRTVVEPLADITASRRRSQPSAVSGRYAGSGRRRAATPLAGSPAARGWAATCQWH